MPQDLIPKSWLGTNTIHFSFAVNALAYVVIWAVALLGLYLIWRSPRARSLARNWSTRDILVVAVMGVLLEVYDNLIGDQFITPIIQLIPFGHVFALNDLPYMFLLMVGIAIIRKPGAATAMVMVNFLLMQLLYGGAESSVLWWPYGIYQGLFIDLYLLIRGGRVFATGGATAVLDGLAMGAVRAVPAAFVQQIFLGPFLDGWTVTAGFVFFYALFNMIGNSIEAAVSAPLAIRVARSVGESAGQEDYATGPGDGPGRRPNSPQAGGTR